MKFIRENIHYLLFFMVVFLICLLTPITGDDWGNYVSSSDFISNINQTLGLYFSWEGRIASRIIILTFTKKKILWNIVTPLLLTGIYYCFNLLVNPKSKITKSILFIALLLINNQMFAQGYTWLAGSITYLYPSALTIMYFTFLFRGNSQTKWGVVLFILNIIIPMFVENIGCAFVFGNFLYLGYLFFNKKDIKLQLVFLGVSMISLIIMLLSPGSMVRASEDTYFNSLSIFQKIYQNLGNFVSYGFTRNYVLVGLFIWFSNIFMYRKLKIHRVKKIIFLIILDIIPILCFISNVATIIPVDIDIDSIINGRILNVIYFLYLAFYGVIFIWYIWDNKGINKSNIFRIIFLLIGLVSIVSMLVVSVWGDRVTLLSTLIFICLLVDIIDKMVSYKKWFDFVSRIGRFLVGCYLILIFWCGYQINNYRINYIYEQMNNDSDVIYVINNPIKYLWNANPYSDYHAYTFKNYLKIDEDTEIRVVKLSYWEYLEIILDGNKIPKTLVDTRVVSLGESQNMLIRIY